MSYESMKSSTTPDLKLLEEKLGYSFKNKENLYKALLHPSKVQESGLDSFESNERLEFLGDSVLNLSISKILYQKFPNLSEGLLSKARAHLISRACMVRLGSSFSLGEYLVLSKNEEQTGGRMRVSSIGNAMEAIFGAIFLESDFETVCACIHRLLQEAIEATPFDHQMEDNPTGELQELLASKKLSLPVYELVEASGPAHKPVFECRLLIDGLEIARALGSRRQSAEFNCARLALEKLKIES